MGKRNPFLILSFIFLLACQARAGANIGFGVTTVSLDTLKPNDTLIINTSLINYGPGNYYGTVDFAFAINGIENENRGIFDNPIQEQTIGIPANDSFPLQFHVVVQQQYLVPGSDIFVVWPIIANGNNVQDSLILNVVVTPEDPAGVIEPAITPKLKLYCTGQSIVVDFTAQPQPVQIDIFDVEGRKLYTAEIKNSCLIPFYNQAAGVYFVEVTFTGDLPKVFKVVKLEK